VWALAGDNVATFRALVDRLGLRPELTAQFLALRPAPTSDPISRRVEAAMRRLYDERMRLTGQNGLSDYDVGFTNFLYTFEVSPTARQAPPPAGALRPRRRPALKAESA
jgi:hypothetical protein